MSLTLDWMTFSFMGNPEDLSEDVHEFDLFLKEFPKIKDCLENAIIVNKTQFYDHVLMIDHNIRISYCDEYRKQGVSVAIPSHGLAIMYDWFDLPVDRDNLKELLLYLKDHYCQVSRIDIAYDDYTKGIIPKDYCYWYMNGNMKTNFRKINFVASENNCGHTFYIGSRKTGKMLRIYDKDYESKGEISSVRYEFELHKDYAREFVDYIIENDRINLAEYLLSWFDIIDIDVDKNRSRAPRLIAFDNWIKQILNG